MPFKKGDNNINRAGRPKGSYSLKLRESITNFCEENIIYFLDEIKHMKTGHAKSQAFLTLLNYALPKLTENNSTFDFSSLSDSDIDNLLNRYLHEHSEAE
jgi:hypothetical protein